MAIRAASSQQTDALIADLGAADSVTRETAVARLTLLGGRAVERLIVTARSGADADARAAAWRTLEAIADPRALQPALVALTAIDLEPAVGAAAVGVARVHLRSANGAAAVDRLATVLLDQTRHETLRLAALRALRELEPATIAPILASLSADPNVTIRTEAGGRRAKARPTTADPTALLSRAAEGDLPADPAVLREALSGSRATVPLEVLQRLVDRIREREGSEPAAAREQWRLARAAAHLALAHRGSRMALYDLRESLDGATGTLPVEFLAALTLIGDASCLEAVAHAFANAKDSWWRDHLARAFREIVAREKLTRRHAALKKIARRWAGVLQEMADG